MASYDYVCTECAKEVTIKHGMTEDAKTDCPKCKTKGTLHRVMRPVGFTVQGLSRKYS